MEHPSQHPVSMDHVLEKACPKKKHPGFKQIDMDMDHKSKQSLVYTVYHVKPVVLKWPYLNSIICGENKRNNKKHVNVMCNTPPWTRDTMRHLMLFCNRQAKHQHRCAWILCEFQISGWFNGSTNTNNVNDQQTASVRVRYLFRRVQLRRPWGIVLLSLLAGTKTLGAWQSSI